MLGSDREIVCCFWLADGGNIGPTGSLLYIGALESAVRYIHFLNSLPLSLLNHREGVLVHDKLTSIEHKGVVHG
jgi:hypothetical protein